MASALPIFAGDSYVAVAALSRQLLTLPVRQANFEDRGRRRSLRVDCDRECGCLRQGSGNPRDGCGVRAIARLAASPAAPAGTSAAALGQDQNDDQHSGQGLPVAASRRNPEGQYKSRSGSAGTPGELLERQTESSTGRGRGHRKRGRHGSGGHVHRARREAAPHAIAQAGDRTREIERTGEAICRRHRDGRGAALSSRGADIPAVADQER
jgi:hypothetical protein